MRSADTSGDRNSGSGTRLAIAVLGAGATCFSLTLTWLHVGLGGEEHTYGGLDLPALAVPTILAALASVGAAAFAVVQSSPVFLRLGLAVNSALVLALSLVILASETAAGLIPRGLLPPT